MSDNDLLRIIARPMSEKERQNFDFRQENRDWLKKSRQLALSVLYYLEQKGMTKEDLAQKMGGTTDYVERILRGKENFTFKTISDIEKALGVDLLYINKPY